MREALETGLTVLVAAVLSATAVAANTAPVATNAIADHYGREVVRDVLADLSDADGNALTVTVLSESCPGTVAFDPGTTLLRLVPVELGAPRSCSTTYRVTDSGGLSDTAVVTWVPVQFSLFADDLETGDASAWDSCVPACP